MFGGIGGLWESTIVNWMATALTYLYTFLEGAGFPSWGLAIVLFTVMVKLVFMPLTLKQLRSSKSMQEVQPVLRELQKKYKDDKEKLAQEQMRIYKEYGVNPLSGCLPMLVQMPIWIALYGALGTLGATGVMAGGFLWIPSLAHPEGMPYVFAILTGITQWVAQRMMTPASANQDPQQAQMNRMMQFMPIMFVFFSFQVSAGLVLYWVTSNVIQMITQYFVTGWGSLPDLFSKRGATSNGGRTAKPAPQPKPAISSSATGKEQKEQTGVSAGVVQSNEVAVEQVSAQLTKRKRRSRRR